MPHLPSELWLAILEHCDSRDAWTVLRPTSRQLRDCVEQHFVNHVLPLLIVTLPVRLPTYDVRTVAHGRAVFPFSTKVESRMVFTLLETRPPSYYSHFLSRWSGMKDAHGDGHLSDRIPWEVQLGDLERRMHLKEALVYDDSLPALSFDWRTMATTLFKPE